MNEVMGDIETLSTEANAVIVSIGAVKFNSSDTDSYDTLEDDPDRTFYIVLDREEQAADGRHISPGTCEWWINQDRRAQNVFSQAKTPVREAIEAFNDWATTGHSAQFLWGNGSDFDNVILRNLWKQYGATFPISYRGNLDMRTMVSLNGGKKPSFPIDIAHNALDDAKLQMLQVQAMHKSLGL